MWRAVPGGTGPGRCGGRCQGVLGRDDVRHSAGRAHTCPPGRTHLPRAHTCPPEGHRDDVAGGPSAPLRDAARCQGVLGRDGVRCGAGVGRPRPSGALRGGVDSAGCRRVGAEQIQIHVRPSKPPQGPQQAVLSAFDRHPLPLCGALRSGAEEPPAWERLPTTRGIAERAPRLRLGGLRAGGG